MTATLTEFDSLVAQMIARKIPREKAEAAARRELGIQPVSQLEQIRRDAETDALEDAVVDAGDRIMGGLGFAVVRLSQKRASKVTAGIPDRYYVHERRRLVLWWEGKASGGRARPEQLQFQRLHHNAGVNHVLGGLDVLRAWLTDNQVATFDENGLPQPIECTHG